MFLLNYFRVLCFSYLYLIVLLYSNINSLFWIKLQVKRSNNVFFSLYIESVIGQPIDMGKKLCIGENPSVVLDFMKAGKCVSVSKTFIPLSFTYFSQCWFDSINGSRNGGLWRWGSVDQSLSFFAAFLVCVRREALTSSLCPIKNLQVNVTWGENRCYWKMNHGWM